MTYPTSIDSFPTESDGVGKWIYSSYLLAIQASIVAIETYVGISSGGPNLLPGLLSTVAPGKTLTFAAANNFTLTVPASGTVALLEQPNTFSAPQTIVGTALTDGPTLDVEFLSGSGWTSTGWTGSWGAGWVHTPGNTNVLSQSTPPVQYTTYYIAFTVTGRTAGSFTISFGGFTSFALTATSFVVPGAMVVSNLQITPTTDFNGTIVISIKPVLAGTSPVLSIKSSDGSQHIDITSNKCGGGYSTYIGRGSGNNNYGAYNTAVGAYAIVTGSGGQNTAVGYTCMPWVGQAYQCSAVGYLALYSATDAAYCSALGAFSLYQNTTARHNTGVGHNALYANVLGQYNTTVGTNSLVNETGGYNTALGAYAGWTNPSGVGNVFIGNYAGYYETQSNKLFIDNAQRASEADGRLKALIYGVFDAAVANQQLTFNAGWMGFFAHVAVVQPTVTGSKGANAALTSLLTALNGMGLVIDSST